jgi:poly(3-hydroxybutyrate) depolymerase
MKKSGRRAVLKAAIVCAIGCLAATLWSAAAFSQAPPPERRPRITMDPRAQERSYFFADANKDMPYCVFVSSKVAKRKPAPLIVSLHGLGAGPQIMCNSAAVDLAEQGGYILVAPMGYSVGGWYGSPVMSFPPGRGPRNPGQRPGPGAGPEAGTGPGAPPPARPSEPPPAREAAQDAPPGPSPEQIAKWSEQDVMNVLAMMRKEYKIDPKRIYLTGHSMGGAGTYFLASKHADIWAAVAPVAPAAFLMNQNRAEILKGIKDGGVPILVVQGDIDEAVPVANTRMWVETMKELGMSYEYVELPGITHGPVIMASQKDVYAFFAKHSKKK